MPDDHSYMLQGAKACCCSQYPLYSKHASQWSQCLFGSLSGSIQGGLGELQIYHVPQQDAEHSGDLQSHLVHSGELRRHSATRSALNLADNYINRPFSSFDNKNRP